MPSEFSIRDGGGSADPAGAWIREHSKARTERVRMGFRGAGTGCAIVEPPGRAGQTWRTRMRGGQPALRMVKLMRTLPSRGWGRSFMGITP
ncbi:hypothetical protein D9M70_634010 [compost metagenome]